MMKVRFFTQVVPHQDPNHPLVQDYVVIIKKY